MRPTCDYTTNYMKELLVSRLHILISKYLLLTIYPAYVSI